MAIEKKKFCSNRTMVGCDEFTLNSTQAAAPALRQHFVVCLHIYETFVCVLGVCEAIATPMGHPNN